MERFQDPERLAALFARCRIPERLPWTAAYPWTLQYYEKGEYLCRLREPMESLYLLLEGGIQTSLTNAAGRTRLVATAVGEEKDAATMLMRGSRITSVNRDRTRFTTP